MPRMLSALWGSERDLGGEGGGTSPPDVLVSGNRHDVAEDLPDKGRALLCTRCERQGVGKKKRTGTRGPWRHRLYARARNASRSQSRCLGTPISISSSKERGGRFGKKGEVKIRGPKRAPSIRFTLEKPNSVESGGEGVGVGLRSKLLQYASEEMPKKEKTGQEKFPNKENVS